MERRANDAHMPFWKRGLLITSLLLCAGPLAAVPCFASPARHIHVTKQAVCTAGDGGANVKAPNAVFQSTGSGGGDGFHCVFGNGSRGGKGGTTLNTSGFTNADGGTVVLH
jgi:hypothetical protein